MKKRSQSEIDAQIATLEEKAKALAKQARDVSLSPNEVQRLAKVTAEQMSDLAKEVAKALTLLSSEIREVREVAERR